MDAKPVNSGAPALLVTASPHLRASASTRRIMLDVIIALLPAVFASVYFFGWRALLLVFVTTGTAVLTEFLLRRFVLKKPDSVGDLSAVVTGLLLALNLPATLPPWIAVVGSVLAIGLIKELFGGLGQNFMNPAMGARVILFLSWPGPMTNWMKPGLTDVVTGPTPLAILRGKEGIDLSQLPDYLSMFWGNVGGCLGETSAAALLLGALYLVLRGVINLKVPLTYIGTVAVFTWLFGGKAGLFSGDALAHVLSGGLLLGAFFMATDYATSPVTPLGKWIFAVGLGLLTAVIRLWTNYPEGVSFAIILMNIVAPLIDRYTIPKSFGGAK